MTFHFLKPEKENKEALGVHYVVNVVMGPGEGLYYQENSLISIHISKQQFSSVA